MWYILKWNSLEKEQWFATCYHRTEPQNIMLPKKSLGDFHGGPAVKILHFQCRELGFNPLGWGSKIPHVLQWGKKIKIKKVRHTNTIYTSSFFILYICVYIYIYPVFTIPFMCKPIKRQKIYYLIIKMRMVVTADWQKESFGVMKMFSNWTVVLVAQF